MEKYIKIAFTDDVINDPRSADYGPGVRIRLLSLNGD